MTLAEWSGDRIEYAISYDTGEVGNIRDTLDIAKAVCAREQSDLNRHAIRCTVVQRTATYGEWVEVTG